MPQPTADAATVNAPTLSDEDEFGMFDDVLNDDNDDGNADDDTPTIDPKEFEEIKGGLQKQDEQINSLVAQNERLIGAITEQAKPADEKPTQLQLPQQPADYDETAAYTDPTSSSWKWRGQAETVAREQEKQDFIRGVVDVIDDRMKQFSQVNKIEQMERDLADKKKLTPETMDGFRKFLTENKALDMEDLFDVYTKKSGIQIEQDDMGNPNANVPSASDFASPAGGMNDDENLAFEKSLIKQVKGSLGKF